MAAPTSSRPSPGAWLRQILEPEDGFGPVAQAAAGLMFLTRLRLPIRMSWPDDALARASWSFPLVGALIGAFGAGAGLAASSLGLPVSVAALVALAATMLLTGALHEDGLADTADGFGGGRTIEQKLAIMKDSRIGTYGVLALLVSVALRASCLVAVLGQGRWPFLGALVAAHAVGRAGLPTLMRGLEPVRPGGLGAMAGLPSISVSVAAALVGLGLLLAGLGFWRGVLTAPLAVAAMAAVAMLARRQIGGYTGDVLGAAEQTAEIAVLLAAGAAM